MNVLIPLPDGTLHALTEQDARVLDGFLSERECHAPEPDQLAIARLRRHLKLVMTPEAQFSEIYAPCGYEPAWKQPS